MKRNPLRLPELEETVEQDIAAFLQMKRKVEEYEHLKISDENLPQLMEYKMAMDIVEKYEKGASG